MNHETFDDLQHIVGPSISKLSTHFKESISPEERLAVTLRFLAEVATLAYLIPATCEAIYSTLKDRCLKFQTQKNNGERFRTNSITSGTFRSVLGL